jgi:hypothetical protein
MLASWNLLMKTVMAMFNEANSQLLARFKDDLCLFVRFHAVANTAYCDNDDT